MGIGGAERRGDALKSPFGVTMQVTWRKGRGEFYGEGEFSLCNTAVLNLYCKSLVTKVFIGYTSFPYITAILPVLYLLRLAKLKVQLKVS